MRSSVSISGCCQLTWESYTATLYSSYTQPLCLCSTLEWFYRRPALIFYSRFNCLFSSFILIASLLLIKGQQWSICSSSVFALIIVSLLQPLVIHNTLQMDSQHWQGRGVQGWLSRRITGNGSAAAAARVFGGQNMFLMSTMFTVSERSAV